MDLDINKIYRIIVSEPWDYKSSPEGNSNVIYGKIKSIISNEEILFETNSPIFYEDTFRGTELILRPRYTKASFKSEDLPISVNCAIKEDKVLEFTFIGNFAI